MKKIILALGLLVIILGLGWVFITQFDQNTSEPTSFQFAELGEITDQTQQITHFERVDSSTVAVEYEEYVNQAQVGQFETLSVDNKPISLEQFVNATNLSVPQNLTNILDQSNWSLYKCSDTDFALSLHVSLMPDYSGNLYQEKISSLLEWEKSLVKDTRIVLFPDVPSSLELVQLTQFQKNTTYDYVDLKQAVVSVPGSGEVIIGYVTIGDEIIVGKGVECLLEVQEQLYDTGA
jgi:hypothetical protein